MTHKYIFFTDNQWLIFTSLNFSVLIVYIIGHTRLFLKTTTYSLQPRWELCHHQQFDLDTADYLNLFKHSSAFAVFNLKKELLK